MSLSLTRKTIQQETATLRIAAPGTLADLLVAIKQTIDLGEKGFKLQNDPFQRLFGSTLEFSKEEVIEEDQRGLTVEEENRLRRNGKILIGSETRGLRTVLAANKIFTAGELARFPEDAVRKMKGMGKVRFEGAKTILRDLGLRFGMQELGSHGVDGQLVAEDVLNRRVEELELSVRSYNCLGNAKIQTIRELVQKTEPEMMAIRHFSRRCLREITTILGDMNLSLGMKLS